jgi:hypothetical protein
MWIAVVENESGMRSLEIGLAFGLIVWYPFVSWMRRNGARCMNTTGTYQNLSRARRALASFLRYGLSIRGCCIWFTAGIGMTGGALKNEVSGGVDDKWFKG